MALAAGNQVTLDMVGDGLIKVAVNEAALNASVMNKGTIEADGGNVLLTARSANALLDTVINTDGIIRANTIANRNGTIVLDGGDRASSASPARSKRRASTPAPPAARSRFSASTSASAAGHSATINASGDAGGGTVLIGGNFQGQGPEQNATVDLLSAERRIRQADAVTTGNGGKVIVWSDDTTRASSAHFRARRRNQRQWRLRRDFGQEKPGF